MEEEHVEMVEHMQQMIADGNEVNVLCSEHVIPEDKRFHDETSSDAEKKAKRARKGKGKRPAFFNNTRSTNAKVSFVELKNGNRRNKNGIRRNKKKRQHRFIRSESNRSYNSI